VSRLLLLSEGGDGIGLALRLKVEGHQAPVWNRDLSSQKHGKGLVDFAEEHQLGQTIVADCTGFGALLDKFRDEGFRVFGGSSFADRLESDRQFAEEVMARAGIRTPKSYRAHSWEEAAKFAQKISEKSGKVALKPEGGLSGILPSYVGADAEDALKMLEQFEKHHMGSDVELTVQEFIEGVAVSTEGWFNGEEWIPGMFNHTLERKQFLDRDLGPSGGCSGNLVWRCGGSDPLVAETLRGMKKILHERKYVGPLDVNCVVNEQGVWGLEFTPRFGYDALPSLLGLCQFDFGWFLDRMAAGDVPDVELRDGFAAGVRLTLPPYPSAKQEAAEGVPVRGFEDRDRMWFYPMNVMLDGEDLVSSGGLGILGVMNGRGEVIGEAFARAYEICSRLKIPEVQYRTDLWKLLGRDYQELERVLAGEKELPGWYGVDLDGTLTEYASYAKEIGAPVPKMIARVKRWLAEGKEVRVMTARGTEDPGRYEQLLKIYAWTREHLGETLEVTDRKDIRMIRLYDDRVVQVVEATRVLVTA